MWQTAVITFVGMALLACTGGQGGESDAQPTVTLTPTPDRRLEQVCPDLPEASLSYAEQLLAGPWVALNWNSGTCVISSHPTTAERGVSAAALQLPTGVHPELTFSVAPVAANASIWKLPLENATPVDGGLVFSADDFYAVAAESVELEAVRKQLLELPPVEAGDYVVQVGAEWEGGSMSFQFHIIIAEAAEQ